MMKQLWRIGLVAVLLLFLGVPAAGNRAAHASRPQQTEQDVEALFSRMSTAERVGQLFLVTFQGDAVTLESDIAELILSYDVGGVVLLPENDNITGFGDPAQTPEQLAVLSSALQRLVLVGNLDALPETDLIENPPTITALPTVEPSDTAVPLFIAFQYDTIPDSTAGLPGGFTPMPSNMAAGASWLPENAAALGAIAGHELATSGINMLLGPTLDVLSQPDPTNPAGLATNTFGGSSYWVGQMGSAYTRGLHAGSGGRVAVIPGHFPGIGGSDRPVTVEIPTVRRTLEDLQAEELIPFTAVTGNAPDAASTADGLFTTHIRYEGFQGNIQANTPPITFDPQALNSLMTLPGFSPWRQAGGVIVSDALGVRSVERFYDDTETEFPHRRVARDALLAGNDLLYLGAFALGETDHAAEIANIKDTILWFQNRYEADQSFRQRVDEAVRRILQLKLRLYGGDLGLENVLVTDTAVAPNIPDPVVDPAAAAFNLAQSAITLIAPGSNELAERLASPPGITDNILIFTDVRQVRQCTTCPDEALLGVNAFENRLLALYGPDGSGQLQPDQINSFSFEELNAYLDAGSVPIVLPSPQPTPTADAEEVPELTPSPTPTPPPGYFVQETIGSATWIIFNLLDSDGTDASRALQRFLAERPDLVSSTRVVVYAFGAPYYLDSTEISKLTAYFGVYSPTDAFIDAAVRALFQEAPLNGASPVSIAGTGYDIARQTQPTAEQVIELFLLNNQTLPDAAGGGPLDVAIGDTLSLETGVIVDRNGNQVPDGTAVQFIQRDRILGSVNIIASVPTTGGVARLDYVLEASTGPGQFRITAVSGDATVSDEVDIIIEEAAQVTILEPTPTSTPTPTETPTPTATAVPSSTPTPQATATPQPPPQPPEPGIRIDLSEFEMLLTMLLGVGVTSAGALFASRRQESAAERQMGAVLWALMGSLVVYLYFQLGFPGTDGLLMLGSWAALVTTLLGGAAGFLLYQLIPHRPG